MRLRGRTAQYTRRVTAFGLVGIMALIWAGCGASLSPRTGRTGGAMCADDTDCRSGFCDRGVCIERSDSPSNPFNYGGSCSSVPPSTTPKPGQPDPECGQYLCVKGRCRSCKSDEECRSYFGAGTCDNSPWLRMSQGTACSLQRIQSFTYEAQWPQSLACANVGPDIPSDQRLIPGKACARDCECQSGFCDRGRCADSREIGAENYGKGFCRPASPVSRNEFHQQVVVGGSVGPDKLYCGGYFCIDGRCRSCASDEECQAVDREYRCIAIEGLPGKQCVGPLTEADKAAFERQRQANEIMRQRTLEDWRRRQQLKENK